MKCDEHEEYRPCNSRCGQSCEFAGKQIVCPNRKFCVSACFCVEGYLKDSRGKCVLPEDCSSTEEPEEPETTIVPSTTMPECKENEAFSPCGDHCVELCKPPDACTLACEFGCFCKSGFYRDEYGNCVPESGIPIYFYTNIYLIFQLNK